MRAAIREAAGFLRGRTISISHVIGPPGTILAVSAGDVDLVQELLSAEVSRRFEATGAEPADVVIATSAPWPGDPMQSFKVLLNHRAACRKHGALVGLFWTDPAEVGRSFPVQALRGIAASGRAGAFAIQHGLRGAERVLTGLAHPSRFMVRWARELVIDRHVMIYSPQLRGVLGRRLGPVRLFDDLGELFASVCKSLRGDPYLVRVFPCGGLSYAREAVEDGANERSRSIAQSP
jgi:hypothetical protein